MNHIEITDDFLPIHEFNLLKNAIQDSRFPWFFGDVLKEDDRATEIKYNKQMYHMFYYTPNQISDAMPIIQNLYNKLNISMFVKAKANLNFCTEEHI